MARKKLEEKQIKIPESLKSEIDEKVLKTGLYSDGTEFIKDACRRLIIESKTKEEKMIKLDYQQDIPVLKIVRFDLKKNLKKSPIGDN